ncbi:MCE family protein [Mycolicibacterium holsaticum]|uniref:Mammalian cell entry protein n=1 Tax=Mycolicibacterium holsaticum TaxID=152142 RepID=A0A1E3RZ51_9MYCO|nr:MCE family protein [Mycolicibacterium holsaticum]ODQ95128.1 mammalian cell entry protein [Mycolicibacterium holsaticum]
MRSFTERNLTLIGGIGVAVTAGVVFGALNYDEVLPFRQAKQYSAYFADTSGLRTGADVHVSGYTVGKVTGVELDNARVLITFELSDEVRLGDRTEAAIKTKSLLGVKVLEVMPRGDGQLEQTIPLDRTTPAYQLPDALGDLAATIGGLDTDQLSDSLATLAETFSDTPADLRAAVAGVTRYSKTLNERDAQLRTLLTNANNVTTVLAHHTDQVVGLITSTNALLSELRTQSDDLNHIAGNISALARELSGFVAENQTQMRPMLDKLNAVLTIVDHRKERVQKSIELLNDYVMSLGESLSSGPFFKSYIANLLPGQFLQPFIDAAFSDLGLDPAVLLPSERTDPQIGQRATPALPMPYPRTGQGGAPRTTLPDAITGVPGDARYPYREPLPVPPPGGPPPGPPAAPPPEQGTP